VTAPRLLAFIHESYAIEKMDFNKFNEQDRYDAIRAHERFLDDSLLSVAGLVDFVGLCQPDARPRFSTDVPNVSVAGHMAMQSGEGVEQALLALIHAANNDKRPSRVRSFDYYWRYLHLHPFTDCNGRSARVLWLRIGGFPAGERTFLQEYHYQSLMWQDAYRPVEDRPASPNLIERV
jgi:hypothetical protein